jgi:hypothetical protein
MGRGNPAMIWIVQPGWVESNWRIMRVNSKANSSGMDIPATAFMGESTSLMGWREPIA